MPAYFEKVIDQYVNVTFNNYLKDWLSQDRLLIDQVKSRSENLQQTFKHLAKGDLKIDDVISIYDKLINDRRQLMAPFSVPMPVKPEKYEEVISYEGIAGEHNEERMTKHVSYQQKYTDDEYQEIEENYKKELIAWEEKKKQYEEANKKNLSENDKVLKNYQSDRAFFEDIKNTGMRNFGFRTTMLLSAQEVYNEFKQMFGEFKTDRQDNLKALLNAFDGIQNQKLSDEEKIANFVDVILQEYRKIIRSFTGTPTNYLFGKTQGSQLAIGLRNFCEKNLGLTLPETLKKGEPLTIDSPHIQKSKTYYLLMGKRQASEVEIDANMTPRTPGPKN